MNEKPKKILYLIRHGKSSWNFDLSDTDRPLGKRGRKDVVSMFKYLATKIAPPQKILASPSQRTLYTALHFCDQFEMEETKIELIPKLYHAHPIQMLDILRTHKSDSILALCGHNPGVTLAANLLANTALINVPTTGIVGISFETNSWMNIDFGKGQLIFFYKPKDLKVIFEQT